MKELERLVAVQVAGELIEVSDPVCEEGNFSATVSKGKYGIVVPLDRIDFFLFELENPPPPTKDN